MPTTSKEAIYSSMEGKLPSFSGMFVDENGRLNVYVTDPNKVATVDKTTFGNLVDAHHLEKGIVIQKGKQPWHQWSEWMQTAIQLTENKDLNIVAIGIDDKNQMLVIGFEELNKTRSDTVTKFLTQHQIPLDMVSIVATGKKNVNLQADVGQGLVQRDSVPVSVTVGTDAKDGIHTLAITLVKKTDQETSFMTTYFQINVVG